MENNNLRIALVELIPERIFSQIPNEPDFVVSKQYKRAIKKLIKSVEKGGVSLTDDFTPRTITVKKLIQISIAAVLAITTLVTMSISAFREAFINFIMEIFKTHTVVQPVSDTDAPETIEDIYTITDIPDGFEMSYQSEVTDFMPWYITQYTCDDEYVILRQYVKMFYDINVDTENTPIRKILINGVEGYSADMNGYTYISWDNGEYIFSLEGNIVENELINAANSVQKVER